MHKKLEVRQIWCMIIIISRPWSKRSRSQR